MDDNEIVRRFEDHEERLRKVETSTSEFVAFREVVNVKLDTISTNLTELKDAVVALKERPATMWDKIISALIGAAVSGFVAYILTR
ncbi:MAG: hypothetical protein IKS39_06930 [Clostridia bacterium]|nr:hypothetical protein [Clostridia bacterium]